MKTKKETYWALNKIRQDLLNIRYSGNLPGAKKAELEYCHDVILLIQAGMNNKKFWEGKK